MQGEGWKKVISKRSGARWDVFPFGGRNRGIKLSTVTSFFVSEFPDYVNAKSLFELFGCSGIVVEVAISPRRTRFGKRFAFARFVEADDGRFLATRLDNIMIEGRKLHVNLPRFPRNYSPVGGKSGSSMAKGVVKNSLPFAVGSQGNCSGAFKGASYAEVVGKKVQGSASDLYEVPWLTFRSDTVLRSRFEKSFIGRVCIPGSAYNIQTYMEMEGVFDIKVIPLGGNCCLLEEREEGFIGELIKEGESWWKDWFLSIEKWEAGMVDGCRDVWIRFFGVPVHAWCSDFFVALGERWGRFICVDEVTAKGEVFDVARIMINMSIATSIPDSVTVCIDGNNFKLCIREDQQGSYCAGGGVRKLAPSDDDSSESDSVRLVLSDSEFSDTPAVTGKAMQADSSLENVCHVLQKAASEEVLPLGGKFCSAVEDSGSRQPVEVSPINLDHCEVNTVVDSYRKENEVVGDCFDLSPKLRRRKGSNSASSDADNVLVSILKHGCEEAAPGFSADSVGVDSMERKCGIIKRHPVSNFAVCNSIGGNSVIKSAPLGGIIPECEAEGVATDSANVLDSAAQLDSEFLDVNVHSYSASDGLAVRSVNAGIVGSSSAGSRKLNQSCECAYSSGTVEVDSFVRNSQSPIVGDIAKSNSFGAVSKYSGQVLADSLEGNAANSNIGSSNLLGEVKDGKKLKKVFLNNENSTCSKGRQISKVSVTKRSKGKEDGKGGRRGKLSSGSFSTCYGEQSEASDI